MRASKAPARTGCPSSEELAAFIDGRLEGPERERIVEHLASCEDCYAVFTGVVDFQHEEGGGTGREDGQEAAEASAEPATPAGVVVPFPERERPRAPVYRSLSVAACLLAGVGGALLLHRYLTVPVEQTSAELVSPLAGRSEALERNTWFEKSIERGGGDLGASEFMLGVYWTELRVAMQADDLETGSEIARRIQSFIAETRVEGTVHPPAIPGLHEEVVALIREITEIASPSVAPNALELDQDPEVAQRAEAPVPSEPLQRDLLARLDRAEEHLDAYAKQFDFYEISFGKWAAAGRLAAIAEEPAFFTSSRKNRRYLSWLLRRHEALGLPEEAVSRLREVRTAIDAEKPTSATYADLIASFEGIIRYYEDAAEYLA